MWLQIITYLLIFSAFGYSATTKFPSSYQFGYTVSDKTSGDFKSHQEESDGSEVRGRYSLVEPTGDLRVVTYKADRANGFRAVVNIQPTPTYHLVELQSLQKLKRQHDVTPASTIPEEDGVLGEQTMAVAEDGTSDKNVPQSEQELGNEGVFEKNKSDTDHVENSGPQMISVKVREEAAVVPVVQESVLKQNVTPVNSVSTKEVENVRPTTQITDEQNKTTASTADFDIIIKDSENQTSLLDTQITNNTNLQNVIKSTVELQQVNSPKNPTQQPFFTTLDYFKTPQHLPIEIKYPEALRISTNKSKENMNIQEKQKLSISPSEVTNIENQKMEVMKQNNMMLAALLLPTTPILKFTCTPDRPDKDGTPMAPTTPHFATQISQRSPQPVSLGPGGSLITPGIPMLPFQLVNFSPIKQIFSPPNKFTPQKPAFFATNTPLLSALSTAFPSKQPAVTPSQQNPDSVHKDVLTKPKPQSGYTDVSNSQGHHFLPPPWAPHPMRSTQHHNYRHMPIFVLPMSHSSDFAPMFDPSLTDQHNH